MIKSDRSALNKYYKQGMNKQDKDNAILQRFQSMSQRGSAENFKKRAIAFVKNKMKRLNSTETGLFGFVIDAMAKSINENKRNEKLDKYLEKYKNYLVNKTKKARKEVEDAGVEIVDREVDPNAKEEPRVVRQSTKKVDKEVEEDYKEAKWIVKFINFPGVEDVEKDAKEIFEDELNGSSSDYVGQGNKDELKVAVIQRFLASENRNNGKPYLTGGDSAVDTDFGTNTHNAVAAYQKAKDLTKDGKVGRQTFMQMFIDVSKDPTQHKFPISGAEISDENKKDMEKILKDWEKTKTSTTKDDVTNIEDIERKVDLKDREQRGLNPEETDEALEEISLNVNESRLRQVIRQALLNSKL
jgi:hypothetical protein